MQILDLFSGIGGFSLGFESANFKDYDFLKLPTEQESVSDGFFKTTAFLECVCAENGYTLNLEENEEVNNGLSEH